MLKKGDKVLFSSCKKIVPVKEYICKTDEFINSDGSLCVLLEGYSGWVLVDFCEKIEKKCPVCGNTEDDCFEPDEDLGIDEKFCGRCNIRISDFT